MVSSGPSSASGGEDGVHAAAVRKADIDHRARVVDPPAAGADDALDDLAQVLGVAEPDGLAARAFRRARRRPTRARSRSPRSRPGRASAARAGPARSRRRRPPPPAARGRCREDDAVADEQVSQPVGDDRAQLSRVGSRRHARPSPRARGAGSDAPSRRARSAVPAPIATAKRRTGPGTGPAGRDRRARSRSPTIDRRSSRTTAATGASTSREIVRRPISARRDQRLTTISALARAPHLVASSTSDRAASSAARSGVTTTSVRSAAANASRGAPESTRADVEHRRRLASAELAHELGSPPRCEDVENVRAGRARQRTEAPTGARW